MKIDSREIYNYWFSYAFHCGQKVLRLMNLNECWFVNLWNNETLARAYKAPNNAKHAFTSIVALNGKNN